MKSLRRRFNNTIKKNPNLGSNTCFARAVNEQAFNRQTIHRWFQKLVDKDDYAKKEKRSVLAHLRNLSDTMKTTKK